jgi:hypothetical protein
MADAFRRAAAPFHSNLRIKFSIFSGVSVGANLSTNVALSVDKEFGEVPFDPAAHDARFLFFKNVYRGDSFSPFTSIFRN